MAKSHKVKQAGNKLNRTGKANDIKRSKQMAENVAVLKSLKNN